MYGIMWLLIKYWWKVKVQQLVVLLTIHHQLSCKLINIVNFKSFRMRSVMYHDGGGSIPTQFREPINNSDMSLQHIFFSISDLQKTLIFSVVQFIRVKGRAWTNKLFLYTMHHIANKCVCFCRKTSFH